MTGGAKAPAGTGTGHWSHRASGTDSICFALSVQSSGRERADGGGDFGRAGDGGRGGGAGGDRGGDGGGPGAGLGHADSGHHAAGRGGTTRTTGTELFDRQGKRERGRQCSGHEAGEGVLTCLIVEFRWPRWWMDSRCRWKASR